MSATVVEHGASEEEALRSRLRWLQNEAPRGTVMPIPGRPGYFWCKGTETVYEVFAGSYRRRKLPSCECVGHEYHRHCFHLTAVSAYFKDLASCPVCHGGRTLHKPNGSVRYVDVHTGEVDLSPLPCIGCLGAGTRDAWERAGRFPEGA